MKSRAERKAANARLDKAVAERNRTGKHRSGTDRQYQAAIKAEREFDKAVKEVSGWKRDRTWSKLKRY